MGDKNSHNESTAAWTLPPRPEPNERGEIIVPVTLAEEIYDAMATDEGWDAGHGLRIHLMSDRRGGCTFLFQRAMS